MEKQLWRFDVLLGVDLINLGKTSYLMYADTQRLQGVPHQCASYMCATSMAKKNMKFSENRALLHVWNKFQRRGRGGECGCGHGDGKEANLGCQLCNESLKLVFISILTLSVCLGYDVSYYGMTWSCAAFLLVVTLLGVHPKFLTLSDVCLRLSLVTRPGRHQSVNLHYCAT